MLTQSQFFYPLPVFILSATATLLMLSIAFFRHKGWNILIALGGLVITQLATFQSNSDIPQNFTELVKVDRFASFFITLMIFATFICISLAHAYLQKREGNREEMYLLMILSLIGGVVLVTSCHFASLFIGLEILSVPLYALVAYSFKNRRSLESGIKYLVLSATGSALMLFGMALLYAYSGSLSFSGIAQQLLQMGGSLNPVIMIGSLLIVIALAFKLSLAPFHLWTPDVYEGSPAPVSAFIATVAKIAVVAVFIRLLTEVSIFQDPAIKLVLTVLAALSMLVGNLLAITQNNIKRLLAYSSISHFGYLLVGIVAFNTEVHEIAMVYILVYTLTSLAAFGVVSMVSTQFSNADDADNLAQHYRGLYRTQPLLAIIMSIAMLSMAGIPLTAGFIGKFYLISAAVNASLWPLLAVMVIGSAIGIYYYLRVTVMLYQDTNTNPSGSTSSTHQLPSNWSSKLSICLLILIGALIILLGAYPQPMFDWIMQ